jgi:hypothetical protein
MEDTMQCQKQLQQQQQINLELTDNLQLARTYYSNL